MRCEHVSSNIYSGLFFQICLFSLYLAVEYHYSVVEMVMFQSSLRPIKLGQRRTCSKNKYSKCSINIRFVCNDVYLTNNTGNSKSKYNTHYTIREVSQAIWNTIHITIYTVHVVGHHRKSNRRTCFIQIAFWNHQIFSMKTIILIYFFNAICTGTELNWCYMFATLNGHTRGTILDDGCIQATVSISNILSLILYTYIGNCVNILYPCPTPSLKLCSIYNLIYKLHARSPFLNF